MNNFLTTDTITKLKKGHHSSVPYRRYRPKTHRRYRPLYGTSVYFITPYSSHRNSTPEDNNDIETTIVNEGGEGNIGGNEGEGGGD